MDGLPSKMNALVAYAPQDYRLQSVAVPRAMSGELVIKVEACGICAGDVKAYLGSKSSWGGNGNTKYIKEPVIPGHEFVGHIVECGQGVDEIFQLGQRVIAEQIVPCWNCRFCESGSYWMCHKHDVYGFQNNVNGGMAEYMKFTKQSIVHHVPDELDVKSAVLIEPYACAKRCIDRAQISNEDFVVLSGAGPIGLAMIDFICQKKPRALVVLDVKEHRLVFAQKFGATQTLNPSKDNAIKCIMDMTDGYGCDVYIEAAGQPESVQQGLAVIRRMGTFVEFSAFKDLTSVDWGIISVKKELNIYGAHLSPYCYKPVIQGMQSGHIATDNVVTHMFSLRNWKCAFETAQDLSNNALKVIFNTFD